MKYMDMTDEEKKVAVADVVKALDPLTKVDPQLLFRACQELFSATILEAMKLEVTRAVSNGGKSRYLQIKIQQATLQAIGGTLLKIGAAQLEQTDIESIALLMKLMGRQ